MVRVAEPSDQLPVGIRRPGHGEEARRPLVEPVHDAGTVGGADPCGHQVTQVPEA